MANERTIVRSLAREYYFWAREPRNAERAVLHAAVNDLKMIRPVVLIEELPWNEMNVDDELTLRCEDERMRSVEWFFRSQIFKYKHFPADMILRDFFPVSKVVRSTGNGVSAKERILKTDEGNSIVSHAYTDLFGSDEDLEKLKIPVITYDENTTLGNYEFAGELFGDILPVKIVGNDHFSVATWDDIARYRGVSNLLMDLIERPEFSHALVSKLTDIKLAQLEQYEALGLFENTPHSLHCTPILTNDLPVPEGDSALTRKHIWGRGTAQIFSSVSKAMHEEFDIEYMKKTVGQCGLVYYGCCEALDKKIDIVEKIPNLRKIGVTPWADVHAAAEIIHKRYVVSSKPNPASVGAPRLDIDALKKEIGNILDACRRNHCSCDIVLKDISTCANRPQNIFEWEKAVMEMVQGW